LTKYTALGFSTAFRIGSNICDGRRKGDEKGCLEGWKASSSDGQKITNQPKEEKE
jgi:hypothetical protein